MSAETLLRSLMRAIDEHRWHDLVRHLHPDFVCELVHTGERFTREEWIAFNAGYPGFDRLRVEEVVAGQDSAACRSHVTSRAPDGTLAHFACASFARCADDLILHLTEVWTEVGATPPPDTRTPL